MALADPLSKAGGIYATHLRSESDMVLQAIDEAFRVGRQTSVPKWRRCGGMGDLGVFSFYANKLITTGEGGMGLWWYSDRAFTNFILRGEFLQEQDIADSGVFVRFPDPGKDPWTDCVGEMLDQLEALNL